VLIPKRKWSGGGKYRVLREAPDMDMALDHIVPEKLEWLHTDEGPE
jgi:hypothetical protein